MIFIFVFISEVHPRIQSRMISRVILGACSLRQAVHDQRVARQQLCKHGPTRNNGRGCVF
jgi:hypothetical protein